MFRTAVQPRPFGKGQAGEWRRVPKWLIKSHSDATRVSWKIPLMSAVSNVSHRKSHQGQQPSRANYWGQEQLRVVLMGFVPRAPRLRIERSNLLCGWTGRWAVKGSRIEQEPGALAETSHRPSRPGHEACGGTSLHENRSILESTLKSTCSLRGSFLKEIKDSPVTNRFLFKSHLRSSEMDPG